MTPVERPYPLPPQLALRVALTPPGGDTKLARRMRRSLSATALQAEIAAAEAEVKQWRVKLNPGTDADGRFKMNLSVVADE